MSHDGDDDGDSIQFVQQDETDSIQFVEEGGALEGTARSTGTRRSRAVSIRSGKLDNTSFGSSSAPGNWFTAGIAVSGSSTGGSPREGDAPQPRPRSMGNDVVSDDDESVMEIRRRRLRATVASVSTEDDEDAVPELPGASPRGGFVAVVGSSSTRASGKPPTAAAAVASAGPGAAPSPPRQGASTLLSNNSIVFTVLDEGDDAGDGAPSGPSMSGTESASAKAMHKTVVSDTMRQRGSSIRSLKSDRGGGIRHSRTAAAAAAAQRPPQVAAPMTSTPAVGGEAVPPAMLADNEGSSRAQISVPPPQVPMTTVMQPTTAVNTLSESFPTFTNTATRGGSTSGPTTFATANGAPPQPSSLPPAAPGGAPAPALTMVAHGRTDSSKIVLEHLLDQEASNVFVQHKARMLASPTSGVAPPNSPAALSSTDALPPQAVALAAPTPSAAVPVATPRTETRSSGSRQAAEPLTASARRVPDAVERPASAPRAATGSTSANRRTPRSGSANGGMAIPLASGRRSGNEEERIQGGFSGNTGRALVPTSSSASRRVGAVDRGALMTLPTDEVELFQARAFTNQVRHFNERQLGELLRLDERLAAARMNTTVNTMTATRGGGASAVDRHLPSAAAAPATSARERNTQQPSAAFPTSTAVQRATGSRSAYMDRAGTAPSGRQPRRSNSGGPHEVRTTSLSPPPRRRSCAQEKDVSAIVRQTAQALGILPPAPNEWKKALAHFSTVVAATSCTSPPKHMPHLFFTTGVRLTAEQQSQFYRLVRRRVRGHDEVEGDVIAHMLQEHPEFGNVCGSGGGVVVNWEHAGGGDCRGLVLSSHNRRSNSPPSLLAATHHAKTAGITEGATSSVAAAPGSQRGLSKRIQRTEVVRCVFDLLDMERTGVLHKSDLDSLRDALDEECDLFRIPPLGDGGGSYRKLVSSRRRGSGATQEDEVAGAQDYYGNGNQSLVATAVATKLKTDSAFRGGSGGTVTAAAATPAGVAGAPVSSCPFRRYRCHSRDEFRKLCQFAADVVVPILQRSNMEELEFPHVSMLLLSQAGPQSWLPLDTRRTLTGFLDYFRETLH